MVPAVPPLPVPDDGADPGARLLLPPPTPAPPGADVLLEAAGEPSVVGVPPCGLGPVVELLAGWIDGCASGAVPLPGVGPWVLLLADCVVVGDPPSGVGPAVLLLAEVVLDCCSP